MIQFFIETMTPMFLFFWALTALAAFFGDKYGTIFGAVFAAFFAVACTVLSFIFPG